MSADPAWALQKATFAALSASAAVQAVLGNPARIYDHVPPGAVFPYLTLGEIEIEDWSSKSSRGFAAILTSHVFSRGRGRKEARAILEAVRAVLDNAALTLDDHVLVALRFQMAETLLDEDGLTYHGVARYRAMIEATT
jgi:hypothetical protein